MTVLVTGGAGYIGGHVVRQLRERGQRVVVVDDLSSGKSERLGDVELIAIDLADSSAPADVARVLKQRQVESVIHLAARKAVGESVERPAWYYQQNLASLANLLLGMEAADVRRLVFSSTAAVYASSDGPLDEESTTNPISPYGETKLAGEWLVHAAARNGLRAVSLRYFNVAGAGSPALGDTSVNNLVPMVFAKLDAGEPPVIFGDDYATADGTCVRDYVHILDVADAHLAALDSLASGTGADLYNIGTGAGVSVRQMIDTILDVTGSSLQPIVADRRPGDPDMVVAAVDRVADRLGWRATRSLRDMVSSAWEAHTL
jgi:UDP-glucose 4-epimerase